MNKKLYISDIMLIILFSSFRVYADSGGYIIKNMIVPKELIELLTEVNEKHRIYTADNIKKLKPFVECIEYIETNDEVMLIEDETKVELSRLATSELYDEQWQLQMLNVKFTWDFETYSNNVNVAVIDTDCNPHQDIVLAGGYNFILNNNDCSDNHGHGTHVAGIISAQHNEIGIAGIVPQVNIYML